VVYRGKMSEFMRMLLFTALTVIVSDPAGVLNILRLCQFFYFPTSMPSHFKYKYLVSSNLNFNDVLQPWFFNQKCENAYGAKVKI